MIKCGVKWLIITSLTAGFAAAAQAEDLDIGKSEFRSSCASCHGTDAKGKGPVSDQLKIPQLFPILPSAICRSRPC